MTSGARPSTEPPPATGHQAPAWPRSAGPNQQDSTGTQGMGEGEIASGGNHG